jgi:hypothetical protein
MASYEHSEERHRLSGPHGSDVARVSIDEALSLARCLVSAEDRRTRASAYPITIRARRSARRRKLLFVIVRTSSFVTMNTVGTATGAGIATVPSAAPCAFGHTCRMVRSS